MPDWHKKSQTFNRVRVIIEDTLFKMRQIYGKKLYDQKCDALFIHVQEHYKNDGSTSVA